MNLTESSTPVNPERVRLISERLTAVIHLYISGRIPPRIERFMLVTPAKAYLRTVYGCGDLGVALRLLRMALRDQPQRIRWRLRWWWRNKMLRLSGAKDFDD